MPSRLRSQRLAMLASRSGVRGLQVSARLLAKEPGLVEGLAKKLASWRPRPRAFDEPVTDAALLGSPLWHLSRLHDPRQSAALKEELGRQRGDGRRLDWLLRLLEDAGKSAASARAMVQLFPAWQAQLFYLLNSADPPPSPNSLLLASRLYVALLRHRRVAGQALPLQLPLFTLIHRRLLADLHAEGSSLRAEQLEHLLMAWSGLELKKPHFGERFLCEFSLAVLAARAGLGWETVAKTAAWSTKLYAAETACLEAVLGEVDRVGRVERGMAEPLLFALAFNSSRLSGLSRHAILRAVDAVTPPGHAGVFRVAVRVLRRFRLRPPAELVEEALAQAEADPALFFRSATPDTAAATCQSLFGTSLSSAFASPQQRRRWLNLLFAHFLPASAPFDLALALRFLDHCLVSTSSELDMVDGSVKERLLKAFTQRADLSVETCLLGMAVLGWDGGVWRTVSARLLELPILSPEQILSIVSRLEELDEAKELKKPRWRTMKHLARSWLPVAFTQRSEKELGRDLKLHALLHRHCSVEAFVELWAEAMEEVESFHARVMEHVQGMGLVDQLPDAWLRRWAELGRTHIREAPSPASYAAVLGKADERLAKVLLEAGTVKLWAQRLGQSTETLTRKGALESLAVLARLGVDAARKPELAPFFAALQTLVFQRPSKEEHAGETLEALHLLSLIGVPLSAEAREVVRDVLLDRGLRDAGAGLAGVLVGLAIQDAVLGSEGRLGPEELLGPVLREAVDRQLPKNRTATVDERKLAEEDWELAEGRTSSPGGGRLSAEEGRWLAGVRLLYGASFVPSAFLPHSEPQHFLFPEPEEERFLRRLDGSESPNLRPSVILRLQIAAHFADSSKPYTVKAVSCL